ncbi:MAG: DegT/DnrJ/EryC1/StrS family aminotransferase [Pseudomonadota bacterium]
MTRLPLIAPNPPRVSDHLAGFARIEASGIYSNNGPELRRFEAACTARLFGQHGRSLGVANATLGLMVAIAEAAGMAGPDAPRRYAIVPAMTFAATGQAAWWAGLTPLICDVDPATWCLDHAAVERLLDRFGSEIAVVVPYAAFGTPVDLDFYAGLQARHGVGVVIDAAASLGSRDEFGLGFGAAAPFAVVYSMHATKTFSVGEGGLIHSGDRALIERMRAMAGFGFEGNRSASIAGTNAKLSEATALLAFAKLEEIDAVVAHRAAIEDAYRATLSGFELQAVPEAGVRASQFLPVLLPVGHDRATVADRLAADGIGSGAYFSPHLGEQPWFRQVSRIEPTPVADELSARLISLPITDAMSAADAAHVAARFVAACAVRKRRAAAPPIARTLIVGGGPAGTALLTAASKSGALERLCNDGLIMVERDAAIGNGRLGRYAINSDSTAQTFLTAVKDNPHPELAAIEHRAEGRAVADYVDALGVPLVTAGPLIRATGDVLGGLVVRHGGQILAQHEALGSHRTRAGHWVTRLRRLTDGVEVERQSHSIVVATGGYQPIDRLATQQVAGAPLARLADGRLLQSDSVLALGGMTAVADLLAGKRAPRIAVIGGSTSALTTVALLLKQKLPLGAGAVTLLHRRPLRPFYHSTEAAAAEGFDDFNPDDICPVSGFVYRLAGFRLEARELVLRMLEVDGRVPDPRVVTHQIAGDDEAARDIVRNADLVVAALGYRPHAHPLFDHAGNAIALAADSGAPMVDPHCRVLGSDGAPVPGVYGIGLAAGFVPWGALGGEKSFRGQANGLWLWQNAIGQMIVDQLLGHAERERAAA